MAILKQIQLFSRFTKFTKPNSMILFFVLKPTNMYYRYISYTLSVSASVPLSWVCLLCVAMQMQQRLSYPDSCLFAACLFSTHMRKVNKTICYVKQKLVLRKWSFPPIGSDTQTHSHAHTHAHSHTHTHTHAHT